MYFRKNHGICYVLLDLFFILLLDFMKFSIKLVRRSERDKTCDIKHAKLAYSSLIDTKFGKKAAY